MSRLALLIGFVDNLLRPILVGRDTKMPDYLILLSTLGGITAFGLSGFVIGPIIAEIVEQQERIGLVGVAETKGAAQLDAGALDSGLRLHNAFDGTDGHRVPFVRQRWARRKNRFAHSL